MLCALGCTINMSKIYKTTLAVFHVRLPDGIEDEVWLRHADGTLDCVLESEYRGAGYQPTDINKLPNGKTIPNDSTMFCT